MKKKILLFTVLIGSMFSHSTFAQKDTTDNGSIIPTPALILAARHEYNENNMRGALTIYREALASDPNNGTILYGMAECYYNLKTYALAKEYVDKSAAVRGSVDAESEFFYGKINHRLANLDLAIEHFQKFLNSSRKGTYEAYLAEEYIRQCKFAKELMANPAPVKIKNLGEVINSRYEDYTPSITSDGSLLLFTSRRAGTTGNALDEKADYKFFEDIYFSRWDPTTQTWSDAESVQGKVNTETHDAVLSVVPDGSSMFVYKNNGENAGDIFYSKHNMTEDIWYEAEKMERPVNSTYFESSVSVSADGNLLFFISERPEGYGQGDIYMCTKQGGKWSTPKNLGALINTDVDEKFVFIHPNGKTLFFASNGHDTMGSYDIFKSEWVNGEWSAPANLGYPINTVNEESTFSMTKDNKTMLIAAEYADSFGERDIYSIDVTNYSLLNRNYDQSTYGQIVCTVVDKKGKPVKGATVEVIRKGSEKAMITSTTDKLGYARLNVPGDTEYTVKVKLDDTEVVNTLVLKLAATGDTVMKLDVTI